METPSRLILPSPDARVARSPFASRSGTGQDFWDTPTRQAKTGLTVNPNALNGETFTIDDGGPDEKTYTLQTVLTNVDGNILIGATREDTHDNILAALTLGAGAGSLYAAATTLHPTVSATINPSGSGITMFVFAIARGTVGNLIAVSDTMGVGFGSATLTFGMDGVQAFVPIVQWCSIRIRVQITGDFGELRALFCRPARNKAPLGEPVRALDPQADDEAFIYTLDQPSIDETFLTGGAEQSLEVTCDISNGGPEHVGENWLKLSVSTIDPDNTVLDFCDISGVLLDLYH